LFCPWPLFIRAPIAIQVKNCGGKNKMFREKKERKPCEGQYKLI
jgi:hypothetical protein